MEIEKKKKVPETVAIVAMGKTRDCYIADCMRAGSRHAVADETWVVNKLASVLDHDLLFRMDDLRIVRDCNNRVAKNGETAHKNYTDWLKKHNKPIITSTAYPEFPTSIAFPLEEVINNLNTHYFLSTPAYAVAFAIHIGVKTMKLYGLDYVYKENKYVSEAGRGNVEYLLSIAHHCRGIRVEPAAGSSLLGMELDIAEHLYSYENIIEVVEDEENEGRVKLVERPDLTNGRKFRQEQAERKYLEILKQKYEPEPAPPKKKGRSKKKKEREKEIK